MLKPEMLKALPDEDYENLKKQFFALKKLCESKIHQCQIYSKKLSEYDRESVIARNEALNSEREMNAQLTAELEKVEQRCAELEQDLLRQSVFMINTAAKLEQHREWQATANVLRRPTREAKKDLNKFAIEQKIDVIGEVIEYCLNQYPNGAIHSIIEFHEQLRKEQDDV